MQEAPHLKRCDLLALTTERALERLKLGALLQHLSAERVECGFGLVTTRTEARSERHGCDAEPPK
jgi:hypothetical protein